MTKLGFSFNIKFLIQYIACLVDQFIEPFFLFRSLFYRFPHAHNACEGTTHAFNACLPFGAHALHVTHDNHVILSSSHVSQFTI